MITLIEELSLNAWPALQTMVYDGWVLRFANGHTKRANSVNPIYFSSLAVEDKIDFCESVYQQRNLPTVFKMTSDVHPAELDQTLQVYGYRKDSATSVQTMDLKTIDLRGTSEVELLEDPSDAWLESFCRMSALPAMQAGTLQRIVVSIVPRHCFVSIRSNDRIVACGLGVAQSGYLGLYDIVTDRDFRERGYGQRIVNHILYWGKQHDAQVAYLQVMLDNVPALHLYSKFGFAEKYQYWYRIKS